MCRGPMRCMAPRVGAMPWGNLLTPTTTTPSPRTATTAAHNRTRLQAWPHARHARMSAAAQRTAPHGGWPQPPSAAVDSTGGVGLGGPRPLPFTRHHHTHAHTHHPRRHPDSIPSLAAELDLVATRRLAVLLVVRAAPHGRWAEGGGVCGVGVG